MAKIRIKRGLQAAVNSLVLDVGELALATDTGNVYIGTSAGTTLVNPDGGIADEATKLRNSREFSISGDATSPAVSFDGTQNVALVLSLATMSGLTAGTYTKLTVDTKGRVTGATTITVDDLPDIPTSKVTGLGAAAALDTGNTAGKVVVVGADGKIDSTLIPDLAISDVFEADDQAAMLALNAQKGDICIRSDEGKSYILASSPASSLENWKWLKTPDCKVLSVNGQTGAVTLTAESVAARPNTWTPTVSDIGAVPTSRTVNNKSLGADITLIASDVGAAAASHTEVLADASVAGHMKVGDGLTVSSGVVSVGDIDGGTF